SYRAKMIGLLVVKQQLSKLGLTKPDGVFQHRLEYRLQFAGRGADDLEYVGSRGLLLEGLAQFAEQSRVFDGNGSLRRKARDEFDLLIGKWAHFLTIDPDCAKGFVFLEHRNNQYRANAATFDARYRQRITLNVSRVCLQVCDVYGLPGCYHAADCIVWAGSGSLATPILVKRGWHAELEHQPRNAIHYLGQGSKFCVAYTGCIAQNCFEPGHQFTRRA